MKIKLTEPMVLKYLYIQENTQNIFLMMPTELKALKLFFQAASPSVFDGLSQYQAALEFDLKFLREQQINQDDILTHKERRLHQINCYITGFLQAQYSTEQTLRRRRPELLEAILDKAKIHQGESRIDFATFFHAANPQYEEDFFSGMSNAYQSFEHETMREDHAWVDVEIDVNVEQLVALINQFKTAHYYEQMIDRIILNLDELLILHRAVLVQILSDNKNKIPGFFRACYAKNKPLLIKLLSAFSIDEQIILLKDTTIFLSEPFIFTLCEKISEDLPELWRQFSPDIVCDIANIQKANGETVFYVLAMMDSPKVFMNWFLIIPEASRLNILKILFEKSLFLFHWLRKHPDCIGDVLNALPEQNRLEMVNSRNQFRQTLLQEAYTLDNLAIADTIINTLPLPTRNDALNPPLYDMRMPLQEKSCVKYVYVNPKTNHVHLFMPLIGGVDIATDNTCKTVLALKRFFFDEKYSAIQNLTDYKIALEKDIVFLQNIQDVDLLQKKQHRLNQINDYLSILPKIKELNEISRINTNYPSLPSRLIPLLDERSNLLSMRLSPPAIDSYLRLSNPVFSLVRDGDRPFASELKATLEEEQASNAFRFVNGVTCLENAVLASFQENTMVNFEMIQTALTQQFPRVFGKTKIIPDFLSETRESIASMMGFDLTEALESYIQPCIQACALPIIESLALSPFRDINNNTSVEEKIKTLSIITQFFLGEVNLYCYSHAISLINFGEKLDVLADLRRALIAQLIVALRHQLSVEDTLLDFFNEHATAFQLAYSLNENDRNRIKAQFFTHYNTVKGSPHYDEFAILCTEKIGKFVTHQHAICIDISLYYNRAFTAHSRPYFREAEDQFNTLVQEKRIIPNDNEGTEEDAQITLDQLLNCLSTLLHQTQKIDFVAQLVLENRLKIETDYVGRVKLFFEENKQNIQLFITMCLKKDPNAIGFLNLIMPLEELLLNSSIHPPLPEVIWRLRHDKTNTLNILLSLSPLCKQEMIKKEYFFEEIYYATRHDYLNFVEKFISSKERYINAFNFPYQENLFLFYFFDNYSKQMNRLLMDCPEPIVEILMSLKNYQGKTLFQYFLDQENSVNFNDKLRAFNLMLKLIPEERYVKLLSGAPCYKMLTLAFLTRLPDGMQLLETLNALPKKERLHLIFTEVEFNSIANNNLLDAALNLDDSVIIKELLKTLIRKDVNSVLNYRRLHIMLNKHLEAIAEIITPDSHAKKLTHAFLMEIKILMQEDESVQLIEPFEITAKEFESENTATKTMSKKIMITHAFLTNLIKTMMLSNPMERIYHNQSSDNIKACFSAFNTLLQLSFGEKDYEIFRYCREKIVALSTCYLDSIKTRLLLDEINHDLTNLQKSMDIKAIREIMNSLLSAPPRFFLSFYFIQFFYKLSREEKALEIQEAIAKVPLEERHNILEKYNEITSPVIDALAKQRLNGKQAKVIIHNNKTKLLYPAQSFFTAMRSKSMTAENSMMEVTSGNVKKWEIF